MGHRSWRGALVASLMASMLASPARSAPVTSSQELYGEPPSPLLMLDETAPAGADGGGGAAALDALRKGRWQKACGIATAILAGKQADIEAAGIFGVCRAAADDRRAADSALARLREFDPASHYIPLIEGVLSLRGKAAGQAQLSFAAALKQRPRDPLATYFVGEALHARKQDDLAIKAFKSAYDAWPQFAPALTAAARLMAAPSASQETLLQARQLVERAVAQEPMNRSYWALLADLCQRTGQKERASAIKLQWLTMPQPPRPVAGQ